MTRPRTSPDYPEQDENGVDLSLLRSNMRLSADERLDKAEAYLREMDETRKQLPERERRIFEQRKALW